MELKNKIIFFTAALIVPFSFLFAVDLIDNAEDFHREERIEDDLTDIDEEDIEIIKREIREMLEEIPVNVFPYDDLHYHSEALMRVREVIAENGFNDLFQEEIDERVRIFQEVEEQKNLEIEARRRVIDLLNLIPTEIFPHEDLMEYKEILTSAKEIISRYSLGSVFDEEIRKKEEIIERVTDHYREEQIEREEVERVIDINEELNDSGISDEVTVEEVEDDQDEFLELIPEARDIVEDSIDYDSVPERDAEIDIDSAAIERGGDELQEQEVRDAIREDERRIYEDQQPEERIIETDLDQVEDEADVESIGVQLSEKRLEVIEDLVQKKRKIEEGEIVLEEVREEINERIRSVSADEDEIKNIPKENFEDPREKGMVFEDVFTVSKITVRETRIKEDGTEEISKLEIEGVGPPNTTLLIYIFSDPILISVTTDDNGNWRYVLEEELPDGTHEIYVASVDNSGKIVARSNSFPFIKDAVAAELTAFPVTTDTNHFSDNLNIILILLVILIILIIVAIIIIGKLQKDV